MMKKIFLLIVLINLTVKISFGQNPNYSEHIAPILYKNCTSCHRQGSIAPFELMTYNDAFKNRYSMATSTQNRVMPPWPPDVKFSRLAHERVLSSNDIETIKTWVANGAPRGDSTKAPNKPVYNDVSQLTKPDLSLRIPTYQDTSSEDLYRAFVIPSKLNVQKFLTSLEFIPGNRAMVHHVLLYYDTTGLCASYDKKDPYPGYATGGGGVGNDNAVLIGTWVPGSSYASYPSGFGVRIPKNADIVLQIHYAPGNKNQKDSTAFYMKFSDGKTAIRELYIEPVLNHTTNINKPLVIPADSVVSFQEKYTLYGVDGTVLGVIPHMHLIGKSMKVYGVGPTNDTLKMINIKDWNFHWQGGYMFRKMMHVKKGYTFYCDAVYDNTTNNTENPNSPPKEVRLGEKTTDEMMLVFFTYTLYQKGDENISLDTTTLVTAIQSPSAVINPNGDFNLFPNPTSSILNIQYDLKSSGRFKVVIYDLQGRIVKSVDGGIQLSGKNIYGLDISDLNNSTYICQFLAGNTVITKRFIKAE